MTHQGSWQDPKEIGMSSFLRACLVTTALVWSVQALAQQCAGGGRLDGNGWCQGGTAGPHEYGSHPGDQVNLMNAAPPPSKADREVMRIEREAAHAAKAAQPLIDQVNRNVQQAMSYDVKAMVAQLVKDSRWGAYALSAQHRKAGFINMPTEQAAIQGAMAQCGRDDCKIVATYTNVCYAAVYGEKLGGGHFDYLAKGPTPDLAKQTATAVCNRSAKQCVVHKEDCTGDALWTTFNNMVAKSK